MGDLLLAYESLIAFVGINGLLALSVYATLCCGQLSLANAGFMAIGAYTGALITLKAPGVPFIAVLAASTLAPAIVAVPLGLPVRWLRVRARERHAGAGGGRRHRRVLRARARGRFPHRAPGADARAGSAAGPSARTIPALPQRRHPAGGDPLSPERAGLAAIAPAAPRAGDRMSLSLAGVSRAFGGVRAVDDATFTVAEGEVHGLIGPNGAGKTTLLNLISGLLQPTGGRIELDGRRLDRLPPHRVAALGVARTYQNIRLFAGLSAI